MRILDRYLLQRFVRYYVLFTLFFVAVFLLTEVFTSLGTIGPDTRIGQVIAYYLLEIPSLIVLLSPVSIIIAGLFTASHFGSTNQLQVIRISGVSMKRAMMPLFLLGALISVVIFLADSSVVYQANIQAHSIRQESFGEVIQQPRYENVFVAVPPNYVFYIRELDTQRAVMHHALISQYGDQSRIIYAPRAERIETGWRLHEARVHTLDGSLKSTSAQTLVLAVDRDASYFSQEYFPPEKMSIFRLQETIADYRASGFDVRSLEAELGNKLAYPFGNLILLVLSLALGIVLQRGRGASLAIGLLMAFGYYQLSALAKSVGLTSAMDPVVLAWIPNLLFVAAGVYLVSQMD